MIQCNCNVLCRSSEIDRRIALCNHLPPLHVLTRGLWYSVNMYEYRTTVQSSTAASVIVILQRNSIHISKLPGGLFHLLPPLRSSRAGGITVPDE